MLKLWCFLTLLAPLTVAAAENNSVVVMPVRGNVPAATREVIDDLVSVSVARLAGKTVVTHDDVEAQLSNERMKDAMGCDQTSCAAEIAGALGARYLLVTKARVVGADLLLTLSLIDTTTQRASRGQAQQPNDSKNFSNLVTAAVREAFSLPPVSGDARAAVTAAQPTDGKTLFEETFADAHNGWAVQADGVYQNTLVVGGRYAVENKTDMCAFETITVPEVLPESFDVTWTSRWESGTPIHGYGLILGSGPTDFYQFSASGKGQTVVWSFIGGKVGPDLMPWRADSARASDGLTANEHRVEVRGKYVSFFTNGKLLTRFPATVDVRAGILGVRVCGKQRASFGPIAILGR